MGASGCAEAVAAISRNTAAMRRQMCMPAILAGRERTAPGLRGVGAGQIEEPQGGQGRNEALQVAIESRHVEGDGVDLLGAARPAALGGAALLLEIGAHRGEGLD